MATISVSDDLAILHEMFLIHSHELGRDSLVIKATGKTKYQFNKYSTTAYYVSGLLKSGTEGLLQLYIRIQKPHVMN